MKTKAQVTLFIIIGIIILSVGSFILFFSKINSEKLPSADTNQVQPVKDHVNNCLNQQLREVANLVALQGGYYGIPPLSTELAVRGNSTSLFIPYYLPNNPYIPKEEQIEESIERGLQENIYNCLDFSIFRDLNIENKEPSFNVKISPKKISAVAKIPLRITSAEQEINIEKFTTQIDSNLGELYEVASKITKEQQNSSVCITCLSNLATNTNIHIESLEIEKQNDVVLFYFLKPNDEDITFNFAHKYPLQDTIPLSIETIGHVQEIVGEEVQLSPKINGEGVKISEDSGLFEIDNKVLSFVPTDSQVGSYVVTLTITDVHGNSLEETFTLEVLPKVRKDFLLLEAKIGEAFSYRINATNALYMDNTALFNISTSGEIFFIPKEEDRGEHDFTIWVNKNPLFGQITVN